MMIQCAVLAMPYYYRRNRLIDENDNFTELDTAPMNYDASTKVIPENAESSRSRRLAMKKLKYGLLKLAIHSSQVSSVRNCRTDSDLQLSGGQALPGIHSYRLPDISPYRLRWHSQ